MRTVAWSKLSISTWHLIEWIILSQLLGEQMAQHVLYAPPACLDPKGSPYYELGWPIHL